MGGGSCGAAPGLAASAPTVALVAAGLAALLYAGAVFELPLYAPQLWLYIDIILSTVMGVLVLMSGILSLTLCELTRPIEFMHAPLSVASACMLIGSAASTYSAATSHLRHHQPTVEPPRPRPIEQDV